MSEGPSNTRAILLGLAAGVLFLLLLTYLSPADDPETDGDLLAAFAQVVADDPIGCAVSAISAVVPVPGRVPQAVADGSRLSSMVSGCATNLVRAFRSILSRHPLLKGISLSQLILYYIPKLSRVLLLTPCIRRAF